jgi:hypothetical protein
LRSMFHLSTSALAGYFPPDKQHGPVADDDGANVLSRHVNIDSVWNRSGFNFDPHLQAPPFSGPPSSFSGYGTPIILQTAILAHSSAM